MDNNEQPKVSVIIPYYNYEKYIAQSLDYILDQTLQDFEIIVVNDCSPDKGVEIISEYADRDSRVKLINLPTNSGAGVARNAGIDIARGKYIQFLDADDYYYPTLLENAYKKAEYEQADICLFRSEVQFPGGRTVLADWAYDVKAFPDKSVFEAGELTQNIFFSICGYCWDKMFNREFIVTNNLRFSHTFRQQDTFFTYNALFCAKRITTLNNTLVKYFKNQSDIDNPKVYSTVHADLLYNWYETKKSLIEGRQFSEQIKSDFCHKMLELFCLWVFEKIQDEQTASEFYDYLLTEGFDKLGVSGFEYTVFNVHDIRYYLAYKRMLELGVGKYDQYKEFFNMKIIPLLFATDDNGAFPLSVTMTSILENAAVDTFYCMYVFTPQVFDEVKINKLKELCQAYPNCYLTFVPVDESVFYDIKLTTKHLSVVAFYRLLAAKYIQNTDKIIYLDIDIVVCKDLQEMYNINLNDNYVAGVKAAAYMTGGAWTESKRRELGIKMNRYFNSGVSVYNLKRFRQENITHKLIELSKNNYRSEDQDVANVAFYSGIMHIPFQFNAMTKYTNPASKDYWKGEKGYSKKEWSEGINDPVIIHYADKFKPWSDFDSHRADEWLKYAVLSPMFNEEDYNNYKAYQGFISVEELMQTANFNRYHSIPSNERDNTDRYKLSVIMPLLNVEKTIHTTLKSLILNATVLGDVEVVIIDDGSEDKTVNIVSCYAKKFPFIKVYSLDENHGSGFARNYGLTLARGEYIDFMDGDDFYFDYHSIDRLYSAAKEHDATICAGSFAELNITNQVVTDYDFPMHGYKFSEEKYIEYKDWQYDYGYHRFIFKHTFLIKNNLKFPELLRYQDVVFLVNALEKAQQFYAISEPVYVLKNHALQLDSRRMLDLIKGIQDVMKIARAHGYTELYRLQFVRFKSFENVFRETIISEPNKVELYKACVNFLVKLDNCILQKFDIDEYDYSQRSFSDKLGAFVNLFDIFQQIHDDAMCELREQDNKEEVKTYV